MDDVLAPGSSFAGRFRIVGEIGRGETGVTYSAEPTRPAGSTEACALKVLDASLIANEALREKFVSEALASARLGTIHIMGGLEAGIDDATGHPWLAGELLSGKVLSAHVADAGSLPLEELRIIVAAVGEALGAAHAKGLVHYNLTPENIHITGSGAPVVKLRELGISRFVAEALALEKELIGTAGWMSPEQFEVGLRLRPPANVWSMGLIAFFALTGRSFWKEMRDEPTPTRELLREILGDPLPKARERARAFGLKGVVPPWFDTWFSRCVVRDPSARFADALEAARAFASLADDAEEEDRPTLIHSAPVSPAATSRPASKPGSRPPPPVPSSSAPRTFGPLPPPRLPPPPSHHSTPTPPATASDREDAKAGSSSAGWKPSAGLGPLPIVSLEKKPRRWPYLIALALACSAGGGSFWVARWALRASEPAVAKLAKEAPSSSPAGQPSPAEAPSSAVPASMSTPTSTSSSSSTGSDDDLPSTEIAAPYDLAAALRALNGIYYGDCRVPSRGQLVVTFAPSGRVKQVALAQGDYDADTMACLSARFHAAKIPPFEGAAHSVTAALVPTQLVSSSPSTPR